VNREQTPVILLHTNNGTFDPFCIFPCIIELLYVKALLDQKAMQDFVNPSTICNDGIMPNDYIVDVMFASLLVDSLFDTAVRFSNFEITSVLGDFWRGIGIKFHTG
jgi:hypothetical protein